MREIFTYFIANNKYYKCIWINRASARNRASGSGWKLFFTYCAIELTEKRKAGFWSVFFSLSAWNNNLSIIKNLKENLFLKKGSFFSFCWWRSMGMLCVRLFSSLPAPFPPTKVRRFQSLNACLPVKNLI